jgi:hypothetical protein
MGNYMPKSLQRIAMMLLLAIYRETPNVVIESNIDVYTMLWLYELHLNRDMYSVCTHAIGILSHGKVRVTTQQEGTADPPGVMLVYRNSLHMFNDDVNLPVLYEREREYFKFLKEIMQVKIVWLTVRNITSDVEKIISRLHSDNRLYLVVVSIFRLYYGSCHSDYSCKRFRHVLHLIDNPRTFKICSEKLFGIHHRRFPLTVSGNLSYSFFWWWYNTQLNNIDKRYYEAFINLSEDLNTEEISMCFAVCSRIVPVKIREIIKYNFESKLTNMSYSFPPFFAYAMAIVDVEHIISLSILSKFDDYVYAWMMWKRYVTDGDISQIRDHNWDRREPLMYVLNEFAWDDDVIHTIKTMIGGLPKSTSYIERKMIKNVKPIK